MPHDFARICLVALWAMTATIAGCISDTTPPAASPNDATIEPAARSASPAATPPAEALPEKPSPSPHFRLAGCEGARIFSDWPPGTLPWGLQGNWSARGIHAPGFYFVGLRCNHADVGGVWSFQNGSCVWERHTNLSAGPAIEGRTYWQLSHTLASYANPPAFRDALVEIGLAPKVADVEFDFAELSVDVEGHDRWARFTFSPLAKDPDPVLIGSGNLISVLGRSPISAMTGEVIMGHASEGPTPSEVASTGAFHLHELEESWPYPIAWQGSYVVNSSIEMTVETFA